MFRASVARSGLNDCLTSGLVAVNLKVLCYANEKLLTMHFVAVQLRTSVLSQKVHLWNLSWSV
jgi:hypothetical protein